MSKVLFCECELVPKYEIEWGVDEYIIDVLEYLYKVHVPFKILKDDFMEERIVNIWRMLLHVNFCKKTFRKGKEVNEVNVRDVLISLMDWIHEYGIKLNDPEGKVIPGCSLLYMLKPGKR